MKQKFYSVIILLILAAFNLNASGQKESADQNASIDGKDPIVWVEMWSDGSFKGPMEKDYPQSVFFQENLGVGIHGPQINWNGGKDYVERLRLNIASGDLPDMFQPREGLELELAEQGAIMALDELLPKYAPNLWKRVPKSVWDIVKANSPDGKIYYLPKIWEDFSLTGFIRTDWLDRVNATIPTTIEEYEKVLALFKKMDANGNGDPDDELPTTGRQDASWMDHLFAPYGVAIDSGRPQWDIYDGKLTYSAVTGNMKAALEWQASLFKKGLIDQETLLNSKTMWDGKIKNNRVGTWFHGAQWVISRLTAIQKIDPDLNIAVLPALKAKGYDGFYSRMAYKGPQWVFSAESEEKVIAALKVLNYLNDPDTIEDLAHGYESINYEIQDGKEVRIAQPPNTQDIMTPLVTNKESEIYFRFSNITDGTLLPLANMISNVIRDIDNKEIAGQGMPAHIYEGYPDIQNHTLYKEYASLVILGEYDINDFDDFREKWYASGGDVVTERIRKWYAGIQN
ncbi:MAG: extracellular solute-binding protein [Spirochaetaceae bacterium]